MSFRLPWVPCYPKISTLPPGVVCRVTIDVLTADRDAILSVAIQPAILSQICQLAIKATADYVRANSLTYADAERLVKHVCQRTFTDPTPTSPPPHVGGGVQGIHPGTPPSRGKPTISRQKTPSRRG